MAIFEGVFASHRNGGSRQLTTNNLCRHNDRATCISNGFVFAVHIYTPTSTGVKTERTVTTEALSPTCKANGSSCSAILGGWACAHVRFVSVRIRLGLGIQRLPVSIPSMGSSEKHCMVGKSKLWTNPATSSVDTISTRFILK